MKTFLIRLVLLSLGVIITSLAYAQQEHESSTTEPLGLSSETPDDEYDHMNTIQALNIAIVAAYTIEATGDRTVLDTEYRKIINNLKLGSIEDDPEIIATYQELMDIIVEKQLRGEELEIFKAKLKKAQKRSFLRSASNIRAYGADPYSFVLSLVTSVVSAGFNYYEQKEMFGEEFSDNAWQLDKQDVLDINRLNQKLLESTWKLLRKYKVADEYRLTKEDSLEPFIEAQKELDNAVSLRKYSYIKDKFEGYPPFWFHYGQRALKSGDRTLAKVCFNKYETIKKDVLRPDPYMANIAVSMIQFLNIDTEKDQIRHYITLAEKNLSSFSDGYLRFALAYVYDTLNEDEKAKSLLQQNIDCDSCKGESQLALSNMNNGRRINDGIEEFGFRFEWQTAAESDSEPLVNSKQQQQEPSADGKFLKAILMLNSMPDLYPKAYAMFEEAANEGSPDAMIWLGRCLLFGWGVPINAPKSYEWFEKAATNGSPEGALATGLACYFGWGREKDLKKSKIDFAKAAQSGIPLAEYMLVKTDEANISSMDNAASRGSVDAQLALANMYLLGAKSTTENDKARHWAELASNVIYPNITDLAATDYLAGWGVKQDILENIKSIEKEPWGKTVTAFMYLNKWPIEFTQEQAIACIKSSAEADDAMAQAMLGKCYRDGLGVVPDPIQAFNYIQASAEKGNPKGLYRISECYRKGIGVEKDYEKAYIFATKAADTGDPIGLYELGLCYYYGVHINEDVNVALNYFKQSSECGWFPAQSIIGYEIIKKCEEKKDSDEELEQGIYLLKQGAKRGTNFAYYALANIYREGFCVKKDLSQAFYWHQINTVKGVDDYKIDSHIILGNMYENGEGTTKNSENAYYQYKKAADAGSLDGMTHIARCLLFGIGIEENMDEGFQRLQGLAKKGCVYSQRLLGVLYHQGRGVPKDLSNAFKWLKIASDQEDAFAQEYLADCYYRGDGIDKNYEESFKLYNKASLAGNTHAMVQLGNCYLMGIGVVKNTKYAFEWFSKSANKEESYGQIMLGNCYENGYGIEKDEKMAFSLYMKAAMQENPQGERFLAQCFLYGTGVEKNIQSAMSYFKKSADHGDVDSSLFYGKCLVIGQYILKDIEEGKKYLKQAADAGDIDALKMLKTL